jgi:tripartite-type tricarboxylate transporter receptor subunit TctC
MRRRGLFPALALPSLAAAQNPWPVRVVRIIVPQAPGGPIDTPNRIIADRLSRRLGASFIVENRPGAGGGIGSQFVAQQPPDGSCFLANSAGISILPTLQPALGFDPIRDLDPVTLVCDLPAALMVRAASPLTSLPQLLAEARARPGRITFGSGGVGSANHLAAGLFAAMAGIEMTHVPYRGISQAVTAVYAGEISLVFASTLEVMPHLRAGRARALGVTMPERVAALPEIPAIAELIPGYAAPNWFCLMAPKGMAPALLQRLVEELALLREDADLRATLDAAAATMRLDGPAPLAARLAEEVPKWRDLVRRLGVSVE